MTRDSLRPLEGRLVHFEGRVLDIHANEPGTKDFLLGNVTLRRWDGNRRVRSDDPVAAVADHAWFRRPVGDAIELLVEAHGVARVGWYRRSDGSVDLGLQDIGGVCVDPINAELNILIRRHSVDQLLKRLDEVIPMLTAPGAMPYLSRVRGTSRGFVASLRRSREAARAEIARRAAQQAEQERRRQRQSVAGFKGLLKNSGHPQASMHTSPFINHDNASANTWAGLFGAGGGSFAPGAHYGHGSVPADHAARCAAPA